MGVMELLMPGMATEQTLHSPSAGQLHNWWFVLWLVGLGCFILFYLFRSPVIALQKRCLV